MQNWTRSVPSIIFKLLGLLYLSDSSHSSLCRFLWITCSLVAFTMLLTFKTITNESFELEMNENQTVRELKQKIEKTKGARYASDLQTLIHAGRVLSDEQTVKDVNFDPKKFIVVVVKPPSFLFSSFKKGSFLLGYVNDFDPKKSTPAETKKNDVKDTTKREKREEPLVQNKTKQERCVDPVVKKETKQAKCADSVVKNEIKQVERASEAKIDLNKDSGGEKQSQPSTEAKSTQRKAVQAANTAGASSNTATASDRHETMDLQLDDNLVNELCMMGFRKSSVVVALKMAYNNPDVAIDYLTSGVDLIRLKERIDNEIAQSRTVGQDGGNEPEYDGIAQLRHNPAIKQLRLVVQRDPTMLHDVIMEIERANPNITRLIQENQEAFVQLLNERVDQNEPMKQEVQKQQQQPQQQQQQQGQQQPQQQRRRQQQQQQHQQQEQSTSSGTRIFRIHLTAEERDAVDRLVAMGFSESQVIEAYFACDKNEALAANFLLQSLEEDGEFPSLFSVVERRIPTNKLMTIQEEEDFTSKIKK
ncbi:UV excision repair protein RAD23 -like protein B [Trichinella murrelli]|uniref:UV excision repair protein RAD23-like protein B n=2 Tax=Trichinella TaxID=6333 RepID=A0A0V0U439_9BILA|nr:UV excision repair protein RAD23 -like protein B [Trichinella murrelli]